MVHVVYYRKNDWNYMCKPIKGLLLYESLPEYLKERLPVLKHDFINITDHSEEDILKKIEELGRKGEKIMTILKERELKGIEQGIEQGIERGMEQGIEYGKVEIVENLIKSGTEIEFIVKVSGLSRDKVEEIKRNME